MTNTTKRGASHNNTITYGGCNVGLTETHEAGYGEGLLLRSIKLSTEAVELIKQGHAIRILEDGSVETVGNEDEPEECGLICFGRYKGDRPKLVDFES